MARIKGEPFWFDCPLFADELDGRESFKGLEPSPEVVGADEVGQMLRELVVLVVAEAFDVQRENDPPDRFLIRLTFLDRAVPSPGSGLPANRVRDALNLAATRENRPPDCFLGLADA